MDWVLNYMNCQDFILLYLPNILGMIIFIIETDDKRWISSSDYKMNALKFSFLSLFHDTKLVVRGTQQTKFHRKLRLSIGSAI